MEDRITTYSRNQQQAALSRYAPQVRLHPKEKYFPAGLDWYLPRVTLNYDITLGRDVLLVKDLTPDNLASFNVYRGFGLRQFKVIEGPRDPSSLPDGYTFVCYSGDAAVHKPTSLYLNIISGEGTKKGMVEMVNGQYQLQKPPCYTAFLPRPDIRCVDLLYAFFYAYSGRAGFDKHFGFATHQGDWEHIFVRLDEGLNEMVGCFFQAHGSSFEYTQWYYPPDSVDAEPFQVTKDGRPIVYSALESHASYNSAGKYPLGFAKGYDVASADGIHWDTGHNLQPIDGAVKEFSGRWGAKDARFGNPAPGPLIQGWLRSKLTGKLAEGPAVASTQFVVTRNNVSQSNNERASDNGDVNEPGHIMWRINGDQIENFKKTNFRFNIMVHDPKKHHKNRLKKSNVTDGTVTEGCFSKHHHKKTYIGAVSYNDGQNNYEGVKLFEHLDINEFIIEFLSFND